MTSASPGPGRLPTLSGVASADYLNQITGGTNGLDRAGTATAIGVSGSIPIFQGGLTSARIRQAQALEGQLGEQVVGTERAVVQATRAAFANYDAAQKAIQSQTVAVQANELALEGARAEQSVGTRTVLDVLNAEQELLQSQVALVSAKRDAYVAGFQLLNAMGQAEAQDLGLDGGPLYDPLGELPPRRRVRGTTGRATRAIRWRPAARSTRASFRRRRSSRPRPRSAGHGAPRPARCPSTGVTPPAQ